MIADTSIHVIDTSMDEAVRVEAATFRWMTESAVGKIKADANEAKTSQDTLSSPFAIENLTLSIPRGQLVGVVGPVGSGKSSILQGVSRARLPSSMLMWSS